MKWLPLALITLIGAGCASMDPDECRRANWSEVGYRDGLNGAHPSRIAAYHEDCGKVGIRPDEQAWVSGHMRGIPIFCTPENGLRAGADGHSYTQGACPPHLEAAFMNRYRVGRDIHDARQRVSSLDSQIRSVEGDLRKRDLPEQRRHDLERRLRDLRRDRTATRAELIVLEAAMR